MIAEKLAAHSLALRVNPGVEPRVLKRLLAWLRYKVPEAHVCGTLYVSARPKSFGQRVQSLFKRARKNPRYLEHVARRTLGIMSSQVSRIGRTILHLVHASWPPRRPDCGLEELKEYCRQYECAWHATTNPHAPEALEFTRALNADLLRFTIGLGTSRSVGTTPECPGD